MLKPETIRSAQFEDSYFPVIDGVVQVVHNYATLMNAQSYACVVCPRDAAGYDDASLPYDVFRTPSLSFKSWHYTAAIPGAMKGTERLISEIKPDIIHVHSPFTLRNCAVKVARQLDVPLVATFHTKYYDDVYRITGSKWIANRIVAYIVRFYNQCDSVWACSNGAARTLRSYGYQGDITVMVNGTNFVRPENAEELRANLAEKFGVTKDKKNLIFVGTQVWQKNMKLVLDTMARVCAVRKDIRLWVVGGGRDEKAIHRYAQKLGLTSDQVVFVGKLSGRHLVSGMFLNSDLLFFPSVYDTSAIVLREAAAMGIPALLTKDSDPSEVVEPDVNGFIAEEDPDAMAAKILSVIDQKEYLQEVGRKASETIPTLWKDIVPHVYEEYAKIIEKYQKK